MHLAPSVILLYIRFHGHDFIIAGFYDNHKQKFHVREMLLKTFHFSCSLVNVKLITYNLKLCDALYSVEATRDAR